MMVEGSHAEYAAPFSIFVLGIFKPVFLYKYADAFHEENSAEQGQEEFLTDEHGAYSYDSPDGEAAGVAHEYLGRVGIVPEESDNLSRHPPEPP